MTTRPSLQVRQDRRIAAVVLADLVDAEGGHDPRVDPLAS